MKKAIFIFSFAILTVLSPLAKGQTDAFLGEVKLFAGNFAPKGWLDCNGQTLQIAQNSALFTIIGTTYGGDGQTTFSLPDFRNAVPAGIGTGPSGLGSINEGQRKTIVIPEMKDHKPVGAVNQVGMRYIICVQGVFPARN